MLTNITASVLAQHITRFNMLCDVCINMLSRRRSLVTGGTFRTTFEHHKSTTVLRHSWATHCPVCTKLARTLSLDIDIERDQDVSIIATLDMAWRFSKQQGRRTFMLNFELGSKRECFFYLAEIGKSIPQVWSHPAYTWRSGEASRFLQPAIERLPRDSAKLDEEMQVC